MQDKASDAKAFLAEGLACKAVAFVTRSAAVVADASAHDELHSLFPRSEAATAAGAQLPGDETLEKALAHSAHGHPASPTEVWPGLHCPPLGILGDASGRARNAEACCRVSVISRPPRRPSQRLHNRQPGSPAVGALLPLRWDWHKCATSLAEALPGAAVLVLDATIAVPVLAPF
ncbi:unnamed protein product [Prorocentrum cordatum]|uniref:Uncharacterized protein n=1 Tax=Prorocentrum cordatum TaxID=2364126 RepID=A0ABN9V2A2_9DINO|nr:unnamed protein product [Polarella glacialis]